MKVSPSAYPPPDVFSLTAGVQTPDEKQDAGANKALSEEDIAALTEKAQKDQFNYKIHENISSDKKTQDFSKTKPSDNYSRLLQRLVASIGQFEVRQVIADASKDLVELRIAAAGNGKEAKQAQEMVAKIEKLINRALTKIKELNKEDDLKFQKTKMEHLKQRKRAEEIKKELRHHILKRKTKENNYLIEDMHERMFVKAGDVNISEAELTVMAEAMAAVEIAAQAFSSVDAGLGGGEVIAVETAGGEAISAALEASGGGGEVAIAAE